MSSIGDTSLEVEKVSSHNHRKYIEKRIKASFRFASGEVVDDNWRFDISNYEIKYIIIPYGQDMNQYLFGGYTHPPTVHKQPILTKYICKII